MRKILALFALFVYTTCTYGQDKIVMKDGSELNVKVLESSDKEIIFVFPNEEVHNRKAKKLIDYILYTSGRKEVCQSIEIPFISGVNDWDKVIVTTNRDDVEGLKMLESISVSAGNGGVFDKAESAHRSAIIKLKKKTAGKLCGIVLVTSDNFGGRYNNISSITGELYKKDEIGFNEELEIPIIESEKDWKKVILTTNIKAIAGLKMQESISASAGNGGMFNSAEKAREKAVEKLKKKAAKLKCGIVLITSDEFVGSFNNISLIKGDLYK